MADTGSPWNLPYPLDTDLVKDGAQAIEDLAVAVASGLTAAPLVRQVISTPKLDTFSTTSTSFTSVTGLSASITPQTNTNKVLVIAQFNAGSSGTNFFARLDGGNSGTYIGDAASTRVRAATEVEIVSGTLQSPATLVYLDSPATTSPVTYEVQIRRGGVTSGTVFINRSSDDADNTNRSRTASSITLIEVAA
jgi:hypothetical protein